MSPGNSSSDLRPREAVRFLRGQRGLTLVEVMVSSFVLVLTLLGFLTTVIYAYRLDEMARRRDQVRAVLQSYADQFNRASVTYIHPTTKKLAINDFFDPAQNTKPTGFALQWIDGNGKSWPETAIPADGPGLKFRLGSEPSAPEVTVTRHVWEIDEDTGTPGGAATPMESSELYCEFTATWMVEQYPQTLVLRTLRCASATGVTPAVPAP